MHRNFYHWHSRAELKPDVTILEKRWDAALNALDGLGATEIQALLRLVLFPGGEPTFAKKFSEGIVRMEPTFPPDQNFELLRVMATAAVYHELDTEPSPIADALALGVVAAEFDSNRVQPVCREIIERAHLYLTTEAERVRPRVKLSGAHRIQEQAEAKIEALKKAGDQQAINKAIADLGSNLLQTVSDSTNQWERLMEESQFLWWLVGRRSSQLNAPRQSLQPELYAFPAAAEAAERVAILPPAMSIESLLHEVLTQCKPPKAESELEQFLEEVDRTWARASAKPAQLPELTPLASLIVERSSETPVNPKLWSILHLSPGNKITAYAAAVQYFRELMFLRALNEVEPEDA